MIIIGIFKVRLLMNECIWKANDMSDNMCYICYTTQKHNSANHLLFYFDNTKKFMYEHETRSNPEELSLIESHLI